MFEAKFDTRGFDRAFDGFEKMLRRPTSFIERPAVDWFAQTEREQFVSEGAAGRSGRWKELSPQTLRKRALERRGFRILERTGAMANAITSFRQAVEVTGDKIIFHLSSPAGFHQSGTQRMPQRKVVDPNDAQLSRLSEMVSREAAQQLGDLGFNAGR